MQLSNTIQTYNTYLFQTQTHEHVHAHAHTHTDTHMITHTYILTHTNAHTPTHPRTYKPKNCKASYSEAGSSLSFFLFFAMKRGDGWLSIWIRRVLSDLVDFFFLIGVGAVTFRQDLIVPKLDFFSSSCVLSERCFETLQKILYSTSARKYTRFCVRIHT